MQLVLALPHRSHWTEYEGRRREVIEHNELERMKLENRFERLKQIYSKRNQLAKQTLNELQNSICPPKDASSCNCCQTLFSLWLRIGMGGSHHCKMCGHANCSNCISQIEGINVCKHCQTSLFQLPRINQLDSGANSDAFSTQSLFSPSISTLGSPTTRFSELKYEYDQFSTIKHEIEELISAYKPNSTQRLQILDLFVAFEEAKQKIVKGFGLISHVLERNFVHFCILFYQRYKFTLKNQVDDHQQQDGEGAIETEERAIFEQQARYLRDQISRAIRAGEIEAALAMRESLEEIEMHLGSAGQLK